MSVLACDRRNCANIMCDYYSHTYGYICRSCLEELRGVENKNIEHFMNSFKGDSELVDFGWIERVNDEFKSRYEDE